MGGKVLDLGRAFATDGQMSRDELVWLAHHARDRQNIVEIGSYLGRSTRALADNTTGKVIAVDDWFGPRETMIHPQDRKTIYERFQANVGDLLQSGKVIPLTMSHARLRTMKMDPPPDMVFIDGDHGYLPALADIQWGLKELRSGSGGLLCGHDMDRLTVQRAVREMFGIRAGVIFGTIWWVLVEMNQWGAEPSKKAGSNFG
jgi:hypothetical protein